MTKNNYKKKWTGQIKLKSVKNIQPANKSLDSKKNYLYGRHTIEIALKKDYIFKKLFLQKSVSWENKTYQELLINYCIKKKIQFYFVDKSKLDLDFIGKNHQGFIAELKEDTRLILDLEHFLTELDSNNNKNKIILIVDHITDPQNLGSITRTAYFFGCRLIITENHHSTPISSTVHKVSSGASLLIPFFECKKISQAIESLIKHNYYIISTSSKIDAIGLQEFDFSLVNKTNNKIVIIIGAEGKGVRPHLLRMSDIHLRIDSATEFDSLNVSVATGIVLNKIIEKLNYK